MNDAQSLFIWQNKVYKFVSKHEVGEKKYVNLYKTLPDALCGNFSSLGSRT
jgi:hypothetical protein